MEVYIKPVILQTTGEKSAQTMWGGGVYCVLSHFSSVWLCVTLWTVATTPTAGSSVRGILQARMLEWVAMTSSRDHGRQVLYH